MSETWYPIINYEKCLGCLICQKFCKHGVYVEDGGKPKVVEPTGCVHGCHGCQKKCPVGAIDYADSGDEKGSCECSDCGC